MHGFNKCWITLTILIFFSQNFQRLILVKKSIDMLGGNALWHISMACSKLGAMVIYVVKQACGNEIMPSVYILNVTPSGSFWALGDTQHDLSFLTFIVMFVDTYASWHIISVIILPKSGEGNRILDKDCVGLCSRYQRTIFSVQW